MRMLLGVIICLAAITCGLGITVYALNGAMDGTICDGVYVNAIPLGGMTEQEAEQTLNEYVDGLKATTVSFSIDGQKETTTLGELGFQADSHTFIQEAAAVGKTGNLIQRYKDIKDVEEETMQFEMTFTIDDAAIRTYVEGLQEKYSVEGKNAELERKNGKFIVTPHVNGRKVDVEGNISQLQAAIGQWNKTDPIQLELAVEEDRPQYTEEDLKKIDTILGSYTTEYYSANAGRSQNVENGARLVNGSILYPGDVLSVDEKLRPYTIENGYGLGGAYVAGEVVDSIGGGICQVSTTLYNAVLYAELEVVERKNHSMTVNYVPLSRDAAIAGDYKDLKFRNNLDLPIYVEGIAGGGRITFNIYGCETRDVKNRRIEFESKTTAVRQPGEDVVKEDPTKPTSYEEVTQNAFTGYSAELYKLTYENDKLVSRELVNSSYYNASPRYVTKGTKEEEDEKDKDKDKDKDEKDKNDKDKNDKDKDKNDKDKDKNDKDKNDKDKNDEDKDKNDKPDTTDKENNDDKKDDTISDPEEENPPIEIPSEEELPEDEENTGENDTLTEGENQEDSESE